MTRCTIEGCGKWAFHQGLCRAHQPGSGSDKSTVTVAKSETANHSVAAVTTDLASTRLEDEKLSSICRPSHRLVRGSARPLSRTVSRVKADLLYCSYCGADVKRCDAESCETCRVDFCQACNEKVNIVKTSETLCFNDHVMESWLIKTGNARCSACHDGGWVYRTCKTCEISLCWICVLRRFDGVFALPVDPPDYMKVGVAANLSDPNWHCGQCGQTHTHTCKGGDGTVVFKFHLFSPKGVNSFEVRCEDLGNLNFSRPVTAAVLSSASVSACFEKVNSSSKNLEVGGSIPTEVVVDGSVAKIKLATGENPAPMKIEMKLMPANVRSGDRFACTVFADESKDPISFWFYDFDVAALRKSKTTRPYIKFVALGQRDPYVTCSCSGMHHEPICVNGEGLVAMADGTRVAVKDLKEGDCVITPSFSGDKFKCATIAKIFSRAPNHPLLMVNWQGFLITKYHPLMHQNEWAWPIELEAPQLTEVPVLYNFELTKDAEHHSIDINGVPVATLGGYCGDRLFGKWPEGDTLFGRGYWSTVRLDLEPQN